MKQEHPTDEMLQDYVDCMITSNRCEVEKHLDKCAKCRKLVVAYQQIDSVLNYIPEDEFALDFEDKIITALNKQDEKSIKIFNTLFISISSLFLIGLIGYILFVPEIKYICIQSFIQSWDEITKAVRTFTQQNESFAEGIKIIASALLIMFVFAFPNWLKIIRASRET